jgi:DNA-directed RNA polymerase specialized sigma24 family protein
MAEPINVMTGLLANATHHEVAPHPAERPAKRPRRAVAPRGVSMRDALESSDGFIAQVIELLSHHERMALRLRHRDGLASGAIAARMNLPEKIVRDLIESAEATVRAAQRAFVEALAESAQSRIAAG